MDDLKMVREAYGPVASDDEMKGRVRARLAGERSAREPWRFPRSLRTFTVVGVATAAAAAVGVAVLGGGTQEGGDPSATTDLSARSILLAASEKAAAAPDGRYWRLHEIVGSTGRVEGQDYTILSPTEFDGWRAKSASDTDFTFQRDLASKPLTSKDVAAWKAAGSPTSFRVRNNADSITYTTRDAAWTEQRITADAKRNARSVSVDCRAAAKCPAPRSLAEQKKLATDPDRFKELLFPKVTLGRELSPANRLQQGFVFLVAEPASPAIRAKAFRALADLPGVRSTGTVKAPGGRSGVSVTAQGKMIDGSGATFEYQLILDPRTYAIIGDRETIVAGTYRGLGPGTLLNQDTVLQAGWSSETPHHA